MKIQFPVVIAREGKWFVASCPQLGIATQGKTKKELKENMEELIEDYFKDPNTPKPNVKNLTEVSLTKIPVNIPERVLHSKTTASAST